MPLIHTTLTLCLLGGAMPQDPPAPPAPKERPRVFVTESQSWEISGGLGGVDDVIGGAVSGGARPQTAEVIKTFNERCPEAVVTNRKDRADYVLVLDHEGGKGQIRRDNKFALFDRDGDAIKSGSTRSLGNAVKNSCAAILEAWGRK